jgi:hypothetical protein
MVDKRWPERRVSRSPEGRRQRVRSEVLWEKEVERVMKKRNLISNDAVNRQLWCLKNGTWWTSGKLTNS